MQEWTINYLESGEVFDYQISQNTNFKVCFTFNTCIGNKYYIYMYEYWAKLRGFQNIKVSKLSNKVLTMS